MTRSRCQRLQGQAVHRTSSSRQTCLRACFRKRDSHPCAPAPGHTFADPPTITLSLTHPPPHFRRPTHHHTFADPPTITILPTKSTFRPLTHLCQLKSRTPRITTPSPRALVQPKWSPMMITAATTASKARCSSSAGREQAGRTGNEQAGRAGKSTGRIGRKPDIVIVIG